MVFLAYCLYRNEGKTMQSTKQNTVKFAFSLLPIALIVFLTVFVYGGRKSAAEAATPENILVFCLDESGYNTDSLMLIGLSPDKNEITLMQLPRDTYVDVGSDHHKLNHLYYRYYLDAKNEAEAAQRLANFISDGFGIPIQHYCGFTLDGVAAMIDALGGVTLTIDEAMHYTDEAQGLLIDLVPGTHRLSGKEAVGFARYRQGYITGDLGRLDTQKILLSALFTELKHSDTMKLLRLVPTLFSDVLTDMPMAEIAEAGLQLAKDKEGMTVRFMTLPGEATRYYGDSGNWYFQLNKKNTVTALSRYFSGDPDAFDRAERFLGDSFPMQSIYNDTSIELKEYTEESARYLTVMRSKRRT